MIRRQLLVGVIQRVTDSELTIFAAIGFLAVDVLGRCFAGRLTINTCIRNLAATEPTS